MNRNIFSFIKKKNVLISLLSIVFILITLAIGVYYLKFRQNTSPIKAAGVDLKLTSINSIVKKDDEFYVDVYLDTKGMSVTGSDLRIKYDNNILQAINIESKNYLPVVFIPGQIVPPIAKIVLGSDPTDPKNGTGILASIKFKAIGQGITTVISFDANTAVSVLGQTTDVLNKPTTSLNITIASITTATPTATATITSTATSTSTATAIATVTSTATGNNKIGDVNGDNRVNIIDIGIVVDHYGSNTSVKPEADVNKDNIINIIDIGIIVDNYEV
ncbi:hypothetical protein A2422_00120 [Candidatus Woesebacteria bacterium RIFOXYC1_FULL_31_51]|nr:MAG: cell surface protein [Candidatus Woesebacteria bacterium GW2011_GWF1_31_35]KKP23066.1 MAG: cell surface protein [Candidatus Woesebacteria bacterium GW2011_GWC1_30_29]KKP25356.1 MAG: cell surface protein [Candidatus Woesebacteria bacterium GW2011_GWD1_31_12]KKP27308.1 MAG: cell surface protein [Candidatus Woesebacteria bacterium GW2011_GWB1_31_29]KKP33478.1 MAG: cell surface protein [Candidatus Woesebacteria bacterium GW2011_GWF2_32_16]KKP61684.1 MAG: cell surface protein [Candidatus Wo